MPDFAVLAFAVLDRAVLDRAVLFFAVSVDFEVDFLAGVFLTVVFRAVEVDFLVPVSLGVERRSGRDLTSAAPLGSRDSRAARTLFSRAAIRSRTLPPFAGSGACGGVSPAALAAMTSSSASRYSSCRSAISTSRGCPSARPRDRAPCPGS